MSFAIFRNNHTSISIQSFLESAIVNASTAPKYIICDIARPTVLVRCVQGFNNRYARWALKDNAIILPVVNVARDSITVPVWINPEFYRAVRPSS